MLKQTLLLLAVAGVASVYIEHHCGVCLCTFYGSGCVTADCSSRNISSLPDQVPNETCFLLMRDNPVQSIPARQFQRLTNLTQLDLSNSSIEEIQDTGFSGLRKLKYLDLSGNNLHVTKTNPEVFKPLVSLKQLKLTGNLYDEYPDGQVSVLAALEDIVLNGIQNRSFGAGFSRMKNLASVSIAGNTFKKCNIRSFYKTTFDNIRAIKSLNISHCDITYVEPGAFSPLQNIDTLDLSHNKNLLFHGVRNVTNGLQTSKLRRLVINKIVPDDAICVVIGQKLVEYIGNTSLEIVEANDDRIEQVESGALETLRGVRYISARNSRLTTGEYLKHLGLLSNLRTLDLGGNIAVSNFLDNLVDARDDSDLKEYTVLADNRHTSGVETSNDLELPSFRAAHLNRHKKSPSHIQLPPKLKTLNFSYAELRYHMSDIYLPENSLDYIDLSHNILTYWSGPVIGVENITHLDLSNNLAQYVNLTFFENFRSLKFLNISRNFLSRDINADKNGTLFRNLLNLETLDISGNVLFRLPFKSLEGLPSLKTLCLSDNSIYTLDLNYTNSKLQFINVSHNHIRIIPEYVRNTLDNLAVKNNLSLDLSWNPFDCTCDPRQMSFLYWLNTTKVRLLALDGYRCVVVEKEDIYTLPLFIRYQELKDTCKSFEVPLTMVLLSLVVLVTTTCMCGLMYRYRWRLIYLYYVFKRKLTMTKRDSEVKYDFDAFVSYADEDSDFMRTLVHRLENEYRLSMYIRHRNSEVGAPIAQNIIDGIQRSKKSILLISKASLSKKWNDYELQLANIEEITTRRDVMITVMLETVPSEEIPNEILYHIQMKPPLQYPVDNPGQYEAFWAGLYELIRP